MAPTVHKLTTSRTQEERSAETRERLLDATIACLLELGYTGTSTTEVCQRTGLSRGALLHHFPTKQDLVIEAVRRLVARMGVENLSQAAGVAPTDDPLDRMFDVIWTNFRQPLFHAVLELWIAARTDPELHASLHQAERERGRGIAVLYESIAGPGAAGRPEFADLLQLTLHLMRGMALQRLMRPDDKERERLYALWKSMVKLHMAGAASRSTPRRPK
jgi:AcrR family transcriptional regulator